MNENKKKICITTWYGPANYGTGLQAFALSQYLKKLGFETCFVDDGRNKLIEQENTKEYSNSQCISKIKQLVNGQWFVKRRYKKDLQIKQQLQTKFMDKYCNVFRITCEEDIRILNKEIDIFIAGGDQIWNPYVLQYANLLEIADSEKYKISYGSSVGVKKIPGDKKEYYQKYLPRLSAISVREEQSKKALQEVIENPVEVVVDPTLLFDAAGWTILTDEAEIQTESIKEKYILCYFVGTRKSYWNYVEKIQKQTGYQVIVIPINNEGYMNKFDKYVKVSPAEFLWLIQHAEIVCTDSFHATLFSVQYGKEFYTLKRFVDKSKSSQNGRLENFLMNLNLTDRLIDNEERFVRREKIDYEYAHNILKKEREKSEQWIKKMLMD